MLRKTIRQQSLLLLSQKRIILLGMGLAFLIGLLKESLFTGANVEPQVAWGTIFNRYIIFLTLFPINVIVGLSVLKYRTLDILIARTRHIVTLQLSIQIILISTMLGTSWLLASILLLIRLKLIFLLPLVLIATINILFDLIGLAALAVLLFTLFQNKIIAFLGFFMPNTLLFYLAISHYPTLIYDFVLLEHIGQYSAHMLMLFGMIVLVGVIIENVILRKDIL